MTGSALARKRPQGGANGAFPQSSKKLLRDFARQRPLRAGSLVISVFGDAIAPRGGSVWLGSLIRVLEPFGVNDRLVRTSVSRLTQQGWLRSERIGRRSFYRLTDKGTRRFEEASRRIYSQPRHDWDGNFCLALVSGVDAQVRDEIRTELGWQGFAPLSNSVLAHPTPMIDDVENCLSDIEGADRVLLMEASPRGADAAYLRTVVRDAWELDELDKRYDAFLKRFHDVYQATRQRTALDPALAFGARVLLIHEYRRILLRDPSLPAALLPEHWNGDAAFQLCRNLYARLAGPAERYLDESVENAYGPLPPTGPEFQQRFGGLSEIPGVSSQPPAART